MKLQANPYPTGQTLKDFLDKQPKPTEEEVTKLKEEFSSFDDSTATWQKGSDGEWWGIDANGNMRKATLLEKLKFSFRGAFSPEPELKDEVIEMFPNYAKEVAPIQTKVHQAKKIVLDKIALDKRILFLGAAILLVWMAKR